VPGNQEGLGPKKGRRHNRGKAKKPVRGQEKNRTGRTFPRGENQARGLKIKKARPPGRGTKRHKRGDINMNTTNDGEGGGEKRWVWGLECWKEGLREVTGRHWGVGESF